MAILIGWLGGLACFVVVILFCCFGFYLIPCFNLKHYIYLFFHNAYDLGKKLIIRSEKLSTFSFCRTT